MRLSEPSEHSGAPTATIKYHLRERRSRLGVAMEALPHGPEPDESSPSTAVARRTATELLRRCAWRLNSALADSSRAFGMLVAALAALHHFGYACDTAPLLPCAQQAAQLAVVYLDLVEEAPPRRNRWQRRWR
ncbi:hypothetical protein [Streptomyces sioyaensis]|uniref:hypothetical protein n=1 Tax=Streptomyces sioyaensis TaxID=67364 RepID=UPI0036EC44E7